MNLKEILSYRERCIHCDRPLTMRIEKYPKLSITQNDEGLKIRSGHKDGVYLNFRFDGKYERNKRNYKIYAGPVTIEKRCQFHPLVGHASIPVLLKSRTTGVNNKGAPILLKSRSVGATTMASAIETYLGTTLDSTRDLTCQYRFTLFGDSQGNYDALLHSEFLYWHDDDEFWHVNTWFTRNTTQLYHARYEHAIGDVMRLAIPAANLKNVKNKDQLIEKMKLYTLFS